jgi:hypothetical protein
VKVNITTPVSLAAADAFLSSPDGSMAGASVKIYPPDSSSASQPPSTAATTVGASAVITDPLGLNKVGAASAMTSVVAASDETTHGGEVGFMKTIVEHENDHAYASALSEGDS